VVASPAMKEFGVYMLCLFLFVLLLAGVVLWIQHA
jgi:hypothetical protein